MGDGIRWVHSFPPSLPRSDTREPGSQGSALPGSTALPHLLSRCRRGFPAHLLSDLEQVTAPLWAFISSPEMRAAARVKPEHIWKAPGMQQVLSRCGCLPDPFPASGGRATPGLIPEALPLPSFHLPAWRREPPLQCPLCPAASTRGQLDPYQGAKSEATGVLCPGHSWHSLIYLLSKPLLSTYSVLSIVPSPSHKVSCTSQT